MTTLNRTMVLNALILHETLTLPDLAKVENLGLIPNEGELEILVGELKEMGLIFLLRTAPPLTYTITTKGIAEGKRMSQEVEGGIIMALIIHNETI